MSRLKLKLVLFAFLAGCTAAPIAAPNAQTDIDKPPAESKAKNPAKSSSLVIAVGAMFSPVVNLEAYEPLCNYLGQELDRPVRVIQRRTHQEINQEIISGRVDLAFVSAGAYVALPKNSAVEIAAIPQFGGSTTYRAVIVVRSDSAYRDFSDLEGTRFVFTDPLSSSGYLYPSFRAQLSGKNVKEYFSASFFSGGYDKSLNAVLQDLADAASVFDNGFNQLVVPKSVYWGRLRVLERSEEFSPPPILVSTFLPETFRRRIKQVLLGLHENPAGRLTLTKIGADRFVSAENVNYAKVLHMQEVVSARKP